MDHKCILKLVTKDHKCVLLHIITVCLHTPDHMYNIFLKSLLDIILWFYNIPDVSTIS